MKPIQTLSSAAIAFGVAAFCIAAAQAAESLGIGQVNEFGDPGKQ